MASNTDNRDPDHPSVGSSEDLEEALKWLEELTSRQGKPAELSNPVPPASLDSPFRGLIDSDEGDLPDWLREVPTAPNTEGFAEGEAESRLDWLAKMAQRESIEELPTLEWRRLSEPVQSSILSRTPEKLIPEDLIEETDSRIVDEVARIETAAEASEEILLPDEILETGDSVSQTDALAAEAIDLSVEEMPDEPTATVEPEAFPPQPEPIEDLALSLAFDEDEEVPSIDDLDAAMAWIEELAASQDAPIEDIPSVADRALASKLMMEAGLTPEVSPLDELGSDSDLIEGLTPTHPFIEEEDFADTVVLVETMAADQDHRIGAAEAPSPIEDEGGVVDASIAESFGLGEITPYDIPPTESSFDDAMAFLDEIAGANEVDPESIDSEMLLDEVAESSVTEEEADVYAEHPVVAATDSADLEEAALPAAGVAGLIIAAASQDNADETAEVWVDNEQVQMGEGLGEPLSLEQSALEESDATAATELKAEHVLNGSMVSSDDTDADTSPYPNGQGHGELENTLLALDALALPHGKTLEDIDAKLRAAEMTPWRDVSTALDWLESALAPARQTPLPPTSDLDEEELIARMPDDPDAVLAWLEQMAAEEDALLAQPAPSGETFSPMPATDGPSEVLIEELVEADLLNMPEDPDEAMAWLEGIARGDRPAQPAQPEPVEVEPVADDYPAPAVAAVEPIEEAPPVATEAPEPRQRRQRRKSAAPNLEIEPAPGPRPDESERQGEAWVDLLKPLE